MHRFGGHNLSTIAERLGVSVATAHRLVKAALMEVAAVLSDESGEGS